MRLARTAGLLCLVVAIFGGSYPSRVEHHLGLAMTGFEQVRSVVAALDGDLEAANRVDLGAAATGGSLRRP